MRALQTLLNRHVGSGIPLGHARLPLRPSRGAPARNAKNAASDATSGDSVIPALRHLRQDAQSGMVAWTIACLSWSAVFVFGAGLHLGVGAAAFAALGLLGAVGLCSFGSTPRRSAREIAAITLQLATSLQGAERRRALGVVARSLGDGAVQVPGKDEVDATPGQAEQRGDEALRLGNARQALANFERALLEQRASTELSTTVRILLRLAQASLLLPDLEGADARLVEARALALADGNEGLADCERGSAEIALCRGDLGRAREGFAAAARLYAELGDDLGHACCVVRLAAIAACEGEHDAAQSAFQQAIAIFDTERDDAARAAACLGLADTLRSTGQHQRAAETYQTAVSLLGGEGDRLNLAEALRGLGDVSVDMRRADEAEALYRQALAIFLAPEVQNARGEADCLRGLAGVRRLRGERDASARYLTAARAGFSGIGDKHLAAEVDRELAATPRIRPE